MLTGHDSSDNFAITIEEIEDDVHSGANEKENNYHSPNSSRKENNMVLPWMIPRPSLVKNEYVNEVTDDENAYKYQSATFPQKLQLALPSTFAKDHSSSSATSSTSKASTKSANSNTLLLTAANLAKFSFDNNGKPHHEYAISNLRNYDTESLASSTHFTLVNGMERKLPKHMKPVKCCCERHQLTILITTMTLFLAFTIFLCTYFVHAKAQVQGRLS